MEDYFDIDDIDADADDQDDADKGNTVRSEETAP